MDTVCAPDLLNRTREVLEDLGREVRDGRWKQATRETMARACDAFDRIVEADEVVRDAGLEAAIPAIVGWLRAWLTTCELLEAHLRAYAPGEERAELTKRIDEARWMLAPASTALNSPRLVELRDAAIDELRARKN